MYYYLKSIQSHIENNYSKGSCNQSLDVKNLNRMEIPIPHMDDQLSIINQMESASIKITGLQKIVDIMKFTDIPLRFKIGLNMNLHLAEWVPFGDIFDLVKGELQSSKVEEDENGDGVFVNLSKKQEFTKINNSIIDGNNVFISSISPIGLIQFYSGKCNYSNLLYRLIPKQTNINLKYMYYYLKSIQSHIENNYSKGSCNQSLDVKNFNRMEIPLLPINIQNYIINTVNDLEKVIERWEKDIDELKLQDILNFSTYLETHYNENQKKIK
jgi:restriction endonuclease S subunit